MGVAVARTTKDERAKEKREERVRSSSTHRPACAFHLK